MTLIRTDIQAALNDLFMLISRSEEDYRAAAGQLEEKSAANFLNTITKRRQVLADKLERAIRAEDSLPSEPDRDLKAGEQLLQSFAPLLAEDKTKEIFKKRQDADRELLARLNDDELSALDKSHKALKEVCRTQLEETLVELAQRLR
ncbi:hypothetical protein ACJJIC_16110 [Microbulbifer sp. ANSA002]|uniref:hypothetical protein n=1 Tax=unclassified Microbulbifer TaxID=2619833 RepID=UPI004043631E